MIENLYVSALQVKNDWDRSLSDALRLEDRDAAIDAIDELKTSRDLFIRKTRRALGRAKTRIDSADPETLRLARAQAEQKKLELESLLVTWERAHDFDSIQKCVGTYILLLRRPGMVVITEGDAFPASAQRATDPADET